MWGTKEKNEILCLYPGGKANVILVQLHLFNVPQEPLVLTDTALSINRTLKGTSIKPSDTIKIKLEHSWSETIITQTDRGKKITPRNMGLELIKPWRKQY